MMETCYAWRDGSRFRVSPAVAARELSQCTDEKGNILPQLVVDRARPQSSPIHLEFEWNDTLAAEEHRKHVARIMANSLITLVTRKKSEPVNVEANVVKTQRALVHMHNGYRWASDVMSEETGYAYLLSQARRDAQTFAMKYRSLAEVSAIIEAIEATAI